MWEELGFCDLGFLGLSHCVTAVKQTEKLWSQASEAPKRARLENFISMYRSRIERFFGSLTRFRLFYDQHRLEAETMTCLIDAVLSCEHMWQLWRVDKLYDEPQINAPLAWRLAVQKNEGACFCNGETDERLKQRAKDRRLQIVDDIPFAFQKQKEEDPLHFTKKEGHASIGKKREREEVAVPRPRVYETVE